MYEGKQVVRFVNNYKSKDLYNIGNEMDKASEDFYKLFEQEK